VLRHCGEYCSFTQNPADDQEYSAKWLTDVEASYRMAHYTVAIGVQNLFDGFPDRNSTVTSFNGIQTYPSQSPFGMKRPRAVPPDRPDILNAVARARPAALIKSTVDR
jgi:hypothetical protein